VDEGEDVAADEEVEGGVAEAVEVVEEEEAEANNIQTTANRSTKYPSQTTSWNASTTPSTSSQKVPSEMHSGLLSAANSPTRSALLALKVTP